MFSYDPMINNTTLQTVMLNRLPCYRPSDLIVRMMTTNENRLRHQLSPYLLQHKTNPVDWYPWGQEAIQEARRQQKMIFLSIGYSTCHWCHVMERESFESQATADIMNQKFINIKVREFDHQRVSG